MEFIWDEYVPIISTTVVSLLTGAFLARLLYKGRDLKAFDLGMK